MFSECSFFKVVKSQDCVVKSYPFLKQTLVFMCLQCTSLENTVGKGQIAFLSVFSTHLENFLSFLSNLKMLSAKSFSLEESKICCLGKG